MTQGVRPSRIVSIWFPTLTLEHWIRATREVRSLPKADLPVVLTRQGAHGPVICACNATATARGVRMGDRVVDAQAIHPDLHVEPADLDADDRLMGRLVHWARRWCPWSVQDGRDGLILDMTGSAHLFGGEKAVLRDICQRFALQGLTAQVAMAPTRGAAQALARYGNARTVCGPDDVGDCLASLPVQALRLDGTTLTVLGRLGLKTIGLLAGVPRAALMRRFATLAQDRNPLVLLDRALGRLPDPLNAPADPVHFMARARLGEPVIDPYPHLQGLVDNLCAALGEAEQGARQVVLTIYRIDSECRHVPLTMARPTRDPVHLRRLFVGKLDSIDPGFGFDLLTLSATRVEPVLRIQDRLDGKRDTNADIAGLVDRLSARLGRDKVTWSTWVQTHKPERVEGRAPALAGAPCAPEAEPPLDRPLRLLDSAEEVQVLYAVPEGPPAQFRWRRVVYRAVRHAGPERIAPEWWRDKPGTRLRDYYKVEVQGGRRFWLYREGLLHDGRGGTPRWFLHGMFA